MKKSYIEFAAWVAIILVVIVIGRWAFSVDTHAQEDGELGQGWAWLTPTPTPEVKKKEEPPDCEDPGNSGYPECQGYVPIADRTATAVHNANLTATAIAQRKTATAVHNANLTATAVARPGPNPNPNPATPTPTPTRTPLPFKFTLSGAGVGAHDETHLANWEVLQWGQLRLSATPARAGVSVSGYEFQIVLNSGNTGFYASLDGVCANSINDPSKQVTRWFSPLDRGQWPWVARCEIGKANNGGFVVRARPLGGGPHSVVNLGTTGSVGVAWHNEVLSLPYTIGIDTLAGSEPSYMMHGRRLTVEVNKNLTVVEFAAAANAWNAAAGENVLKPHQLGGAEPLRLEVKGYWDGAAKCRSLELACVVSDSHSRPHILKQTIWVKFPPARFYEGLMTEWTDNFALASDPILSHRYFYLPSTLMHEAGHTFRLGHSKPGTIMGETPIGFPVRGLKPNDRWGAREMTKPHGSTHR